MIRSRNPVFQSLWNDAFLIFLFENRKRLFKKTKKKSLVRGETRIFYRLIINNLMSSHALSRSSSCSGEMLHTTSLLLLYRLKRRSHHYGTRREGGDVKEYDLTVEMSWQSIVSPRCPLEEFVFCFCLSRNFSRFVSGLRNSNPFHSRRGCFYTEPRESPVMTSRSSPK